MVNTVNAILPAITPGLTAVAGAFNTMFTQGRHPAPRPGDGVHHPRDRHHIRTAFTNLAPAIAPFVGALAEILQVTLPAALTLIETGCRQVSHRPARQHGCQPPADQLRGQQVQHAGQRHHPAAAEMTGHDIIPTTDLAGANTSVDLMVDGLRLLKAAGALPTVE